MSFIIDTCVISELIKKNPDKNVVHWIAAIEESRLYLSVLTIGELHKGIEKLPKSKKKTALHNWVTHDLTERFNNRIIDFDIKIASLWGKIQALSELSGRPLLTVDGQIAATGIALNFTVITRNTQDMERSGVSLINPWEDA